MLEIIHIKKSFVNKSGQSPITPVVDDVSIEIKEGEFFSLLGPSGCGKTTLLRILAGLETADSGEIHIAGKRIDQLSAQTRPFNMVFQKYALFPHLSVFENVAFGLKIKKVPREEIYQRVKEVLEMVAIWPMKDRLPETLSGGQCQRVAIARALVNRPKVLLLDEPLSALDQKLREHMQTELKLLQRKLGITFIYVTHDQEEALALSDRIGVMNAGKLEQVSEPQDLYEEPSSLFAAQFVGPMTSLNAEFMEMDGSLAKLKFHDVILKARPKNLVNSHARSLTLVRPEKLHVAHADDFKKNMNVLKGIVKHKVFRGTQTEVIVEIAPDCLIKAFLRADDVAQENLPMGREVQLAFDPQHTFLFFEQ